MQYLDDFFMVQRPNMVRSSIMSVFKLVCDQIGMLVSLDKLEGPTQVTEFLGLTIDTIQIVVQIPKDKMQDISFILITMIRKRKATAAEQIKLYSKSCASRKEFHKKSLQVFSRNPQTQTH